MNWEVEYTNEFEEWWDTLTSDEQGAIDQAFAKLIESGPALGRPLVDTITTSRHANMKELRPPGGFLRILFAFDPRRSALLLIGGNKKGKWAAWYRQMVPVADQLYDDHLAALRQEGDVP